MQDEKQFEQLMLQYTQLKNGAEDIAQMIEKENFDSALTMLKSREELFLSCKCIRKYLELTQTQEKELNILLDELKELELNNMRTLAKSMADLKTELKTAQQNEKLQQAYDFNVDQTGNILNIEE